MLFGIKMILLRREHNVTRHYLIGNDNNLLSAFLFLLVSWSATVWEILNFKLRSLRRYLKNRSNWTNKSLERSKNRNVIDFCSRLFSRRFWHSSLLTNHTSKSTLNKENLSRSNMLNILFHFEEKLRSSRWNRVQYKNAAAIVTKRSVWIFWHQHFRSSMVYD